MAAAISPMTSAGVEGTTTFSQITTALKRIIGDAAIDEFAQQTRSDQMGQTAVQIALKVRAVAEYFENCFITGDTGSNSKQFDGLRVMCTTANSNRVGCSNDQVDGAILTLDDLDTLIDTVKGPVDLLIMSQKSKRKLKNLFRSAGTSLDVRQELGMPIDYYSGIPIAATNFITDTLTKGGSTDTSEIYAVSLAEGFGVVGENATLGIDLQAGQAVIVKDMAEAVFFGAKVVKIVWRSRDLERDLLDDFDAVNL